MKLTKKRQQILNALTAHRGTLTAKQLHAQLPAIDLVTIYRTLDLLVQEKIITQVHLGSGEAQYEYQHEPHHHAVCVDCDKVIHFAVKEAALLQLLPVQDFQVDAVELTVRGHCTKHKGVLS